MAWIYLILFIAAVAGAIRFRRYLSDPFGKWTDWVETKLRPNMGRAGTVLMFLTVALWLVIYLTAPEGERESLGDLLKGYSDSLTGAKEEVK